MKNIEALKNITEVSKELNIENVHVSLSHEEDKAIAFTISEIEE